MVRFNSIIKDKSSVISDVFSKINKVNFVFEKSFIIDENKLNLKYKDLEDITQSVDFIDLFDTLKKHEQYPAIYVFGINPEINYANIISSIKEVKSLRIPALNKNKENKGILYVGKVKSLLWGRFIQHLGYHKNQKSHGLQIENWIKKIHNPKLTFSVVFLPKESAEYIEVLEKEIAKELNPIIGKH